MTAEELMRRLKLLTHGDRMRLMVEVGRASVRDPDAAAVLKELERGDIEVRWLALQSCFGSGDGTRAMRALSDPSRRIHRQAVRLIPIVCDDAQVQDALEKGSYRERHVMLRRLHARGRQAPIDAFLSWSATLGEGRVSSLLPYGSAPVVVQHIEWMTERSDTRDWQRLARFHLHLAVETLHRRAQAVERLDERIVAQANAALPALAERCADQAVDLVEVLARHVPLSQLKLQRLAERRPARVTDLILRSPEGAEVILTHIAHRLDLERLLGLADRRPDTLWGILGWLHRLPAEWRAEVEAVYRRARLQRCNSLGP